MNNKMNTTLKEIEIVCVNCGKKFTFSIGEQEFFNAKGLQYPKRCKSCRGLKKKHKRIPTIVGEKNPIIIKTPIDTEEQRRKNALARDQLDVQRKCGECAIGNKDSCPRPTHVNTDGACDRFVSKKILPKEMESGFPTQGRATRIKYGKSGQSQFKRSKHETL